MGLFRTDDVPFTDAAQRLLGVARTEADQLGHAYLGTEHLVLALTHPPYDVGTLAPLGLDALRVRTALAAVVKRGGPTSPSGRERPFTSRTKTAIAFAAERARGLGHARVGVAHLVVGLLQEGANLGAQMLLHHGATLATAVAHAEQLGAQPD